MFFTTKYLANDKASYVPRQMQLLWLLLVSFCWNKHSSYYLKIGQSIIWYNNTHLILSIYVYLIYLYHVCFQYNVLTTRIYTCCDLFPTSVCSRSVCRHDVFKLRLTKALQPCGEVEFYLDGDMVSLSTLMSQEVGKWVLSGYNPNIPHL